MRITGGQVKGRIIASPKGMNIRPTSDRVREAIFNLIGQDLSGLKVLDLFAGTGSLGIESLSRGIQHAVFIDNSQQAIKLIRKNLVTCGFEDSGTVLKRDLKKSAVLSHPVLQQRFDLLFLDPPYREGLLIPLLEKISTADILSNGSRVVVELSKNEILPSSFGNLNTADSRRYGDTMIKIYAHEVTP
jgi:16S rRNA (guanine966-N2)-methyltransferase